MEIEALRTETSTTYATSDGKSLKTEFHTDPIRVKRNEEWLPVDPTLIVENGIVKPRTTAVDLSLSNGGDTRLLTLVGETAKTGGRRLSTEISSPTRLPKPRLSGNQAEYQSVYGRNVDLVVVSTPAGFHQEIVIRERPKEKLKLRVPIELPAGVSLRENASGKTLLLADKGKKLIADISTVPMMDAVASDLNSGPEDGQVGKATTSIEKTATGTSVVITPDAAFLSDPTVTYPVTMTATSSEWIGYSGTQYVDDTYINNDDFTEGWIKSGEQSLWVGKSNSGTKTWRAYIKFNIPEDSPLWGAQVDDANLILWNYKSHDCGMNVGSGIMARRITTNWSVSSLSWSNQPFVTTSDESPNYAGYSPDCTNGYMDYEHELIHSVDTITQAWADGAPNYGFQLNTINGSDLQNWRRYRSSENYCCLGDGPKLVIGYQPAIPEVLDEVEITYERDGYPDSSIPTYEEALENQIETRSVAPPPTPVSFEEAAAKQEAALNETYSVDTDDLPNVPIDDTFTDDAPPQVTETSPLDAAVDVAVGAQVRATFDEPVTGAQLSLKDPSSTAVQGSASLDASGKVLTFAPSQPLSAGTKYTVEVSGAQDALHNTMETHTWSFTTVPKPVVTALDVSPATVVDGVKVTSSLSPELLVWAQDRSRDRADLGREVPAGKLADGWKARWRARVVSAGALTSDWSDWQQLRVDLPKPVVTALDVSPATVVDGVKVTSSLSPELLVWAQD
ncbi:DNRLRE domain-containing protein [Streptosporangium amethystogenes]|uniref:DNRLRE domain-containing protein n=1 Tax=Streptosporangium amethystogenes TaxID=2002 RepID=UPI0004C6635C|nr:DNRLRE domain-containing protein [Streptosporangium amethystogenes]